MPESNKSNIDRQSASAHHSSTATQFVRANRSTRRIHCQWVCWTYFGCAEHGTCLGKETQGLYLHQTALIYGYLASRPSRDLITAANQQLTRDWWEHHRERFDLYISEAVVAEC